MVQLHKDAIMILPEQLPTRDAGVTSVAFVLSTIEFWHWAFQLQYCSIQLPGADPHEQQMQLPLHPFGGS
eukprot:m.60658 g.60658  ORF g.60658 m.60658 type:complete len:70 (+) comp17473_c0_seq1:889-1098(+)